MNVVVHPINESYQGLPANLHGLVVEIQKDDGSAPYFVREGDEEFENFFTAPCDEPWDRWGSAGGWTTNTARNEDYTKIKLGYKGTTLTAQLRIPHIVPADRIEILQPALPNWYADQRPRFDELQYQYNVIFNEGWQGWPDQAKSGDYARYPNPLERKLGYMTTDYPKVDYRDANAIQKTLWVYIGEDDPDYDTNKEGDSVIETALKINNYFEPFDIKFAGAEWEKGGRTGKGFFDDDVDVFFNAGSTVPDAFKVIDQFKKSNVKFDIDYMGDNGAKVTKGMSMEDFYANSQWYYDQKNLGPGTLFGNYSTFMQRIVYESKGYTSYPGEAKVLVVGDDTDDKLESAWSVWLQYAPIAYYKYGGTDVVKVPVELYVYDEAVAKSLGETPWIDNAGAYTTATAFRSPANNNGRSDFDAIAYKWVLEGSYENTNLNPKKQTKDIALTKEMFYMGYNVASAAGQTARAYAINAAGQGSYSAATNGVLMQLGANDSMWNYSGNFDRETALQTGQFVTDFPLPFYYRGDYRDARDDDESILINIRY